MPLSNKQQPPYYNIPTLGPIQTYIATLAQTGTGAPVPQIIQNTIGSLVWSRTSAGNYLLTLDAAFVGNTTILTSQGIGGGYTIMAFVTTNDSINLQVKDAGNTNIDEWSRVFIQIFTQKP